MVYSSISPASIDLVVQLFSTLNEFVSGNQANRACILNGKVVDYINFILRAGEFEQCPPEKVGLIFVVIYPIDQKGPGFFWWFL